MCLLRAPAARVLVRHSRNLPEAVARDGVEHVWPAYRDALDALLHDNPLPAAIEHPTVPTTVIVGDADPETPAEDILGWPHEHVDLVVVASGDHLLPLSHADQVVQSIRHT
jgi:pimeloyl-ACP methyl ester carboxylesterase